MRLKMVTHACWLLLLLLLNSTMFDDDLPLNLRPSRVVDDPVPCSRWTSFS